MTYYAVIWTYGRAAPANGHWCSVRSTWRFSTKAERDHFVAESKTPYTSQSGFREAVKRRDLAKSEIKEAYDESDMT